MKRKRMKVLVGFLFLLFSWQAGEAEELQVLLSWTPSASFSGFILGLSKGFYTDEGLEVKFISGGGSVPAAKIVASGMVPYVGFADAEILISAREEAKMPLKAVAAYPQSNPTALFFPKITGIKNLKDFGEKRADGKRRIIVSDSGSFRDKCLKVLLRHAGLSPGTDVTIEDFSGSPGARVQMLMSGTADGVTIILPNAQYKGQLLHEVEGIGHFLFKDYLDTLFRTIIVNEQFLKTKPEVIKKFLRASAKSWKYTLEHPEEAIQELIRVNPDLKKGTELLSFEATRPFLTTAETKNSPWGRMSIKDWQRTQDILFDTGMITQKEPLERVFTNDFLQ